MELAESEQGMLHPRRVFFIGVPENCSASLLDERAEGLSFGFASLKCPWAGSSVLLQLCFSLMRQNLLDLECVLLVHGVELFAV